MKNFFNNTVNTYSVPFSGKLAANRYLSAIRDGFTIKFLGNKNDDGSYVLKKRETKLSKHCCRVF